MRKRKSPKNGWDIAVSVPGAFKLYHLKHVKPNLFWDLSKFWLSYWEVPIPYYPSGWRKICSNERNKELAPSIKVKKLENLGNKIGLTGCKWPSLNAQGTKTPESHPILVISLFSCSASWGNKELAPQYKSEKVWKFGEQNWLNRLQMAQFECPRHWNPWVSSNFGDFPFLILCLLG